MNQIQQFLESIKDAPHDAVVVAGIYAVPVLIGCGSLIVCATRSAAF